MCGLLWLRGAQLRRLQALLERELLWRGDLVAGVEGHDQLLERLLGYSEGDTYTHGEILTRVPGESFLPYMFGKVDDLELLATQEPGNSSAGASSP